MMTKFGPHNVFIVKTQPRVRDDQLLETECVIQSDGDVDLKMAPGASSGDWLRNYTFGKKHAPEYQLLNVENKVSIRPHPHGGVTTMNQVTAVWQKLSI